MKSASKHTANLKAHRSGRGDLPLVLARKDGPPSFVFGPDGDEDSPAASVAPRTLGFCTIDADMDGFERIWRLRPSCVQHHPEP
jgi:hypothetical protein